MGYDCGQVVKNPLKSNIARGCVIMSVNFLPWWSATGSCPNVTQCAFRARDKLFTVSTAHRGKKGGVSNEQMEATMTCSGTLLDGPESGSSVAGDITPKACLVTLTTVVP